MFTRIVSNPAILGGKPCIKGTRISVEMILEWVASGASRDDILRALEALNIESRPVWKPMHLQPLYAQNACYGGEVCADLFRRGLCLPSSSSLDPGDQELVIAIVRGTLMG